MGVLIGLLGGFALPAVLPAQAFANLTELVSTGPNGGNGAAAGVFRGVTQDGSGVFFQTPESLVSSDTDSSIDVYERSGGTTTLVSTGPSGGNGSFSATFAAASQDGSRVFFRTSEKLVAADTDNTQDVYERSGGTTTLVSTGPNGGNGAFNVIFDGISADGSCVFFDTTESLVTADTDPSRDVYERSGGTTTWISTGPIGGNGTSNAIFSGASQDGSHVFFVTDESLVSTDVDTRQDVYERFAGTTRHLSIGPLGGNGNADFDYDAFFDGASADGTIAWIHTDEVLAAPDADDQNDVYQVSGATITLVSIGPSGGSGPTGAYFDGASQDGSHLFFDTQEQLVASDTDAAYDIYDRSGGATTLVSTGPNGGNAETYSAFARASADGSRVFFVTADPLVAADTDAGQDLYQRANGQTTLVSTGPNDPNDVSPATFDGASQDGTRVFFETSDQLNATDTDDMPDIYERANGGTSLISIGPLGGNGEFITSFGGVSADGGHVFFHTAEPLVAGDTDTYQDVYGSSVVAGTYVRPKSASPERISLVPAFNECLPASANRTHGPPLAYASCNPPSQASDFLTVGEPTVNGAAANSVGYMKLNAKVGVAGGVDDSDILIVASITDVRRKADLSDYTGQLQLLPTIRVTDKLSGESPIDPGTIADLDFPVTVPCTGTVSTSVGSTCSIATTADSVMPGAVPEAKRTVWQTGQIKVLDGGADGLAATSPNTLFAVEGLFVP